MEKGGRQGSSRRTGRESRLSNQNTRNSDAPGHNRFLDAKKEADKREAEHAARSRAARMNAGRKAFRSTAVRSSHGYGKRYGSYRAAAPKNTSGGRWMKLAVIILGVALLILLLVSSHVVITITPKEGE